jgi:hypothetical protein
LYSVTLEANRFMLVFAYIDLPPQGGFWSLPHLVGSSDQEVVDAICNRVGASRREQIGRALNEAANELDACEPMGRA